MGSKVQLHLTSVSTENRAMQALEASFLKMIGTDKLLQISNVAGYTVQLFMMALLK